MAIVKINALNVPPQAGAELERRFSERAHTVENSPGFLGFQLLRPTGEEKRYFVVTTWEDEESSPDPCDPARRRSRSTSST